MKSLLAQSSFPFAPFDQERRTREDTPTPPKYTERAITDKRPEEGEKQRKRKNEKQTTEEREKQDKEKLDKKHWSIHFLIQRADVKASSVQNAYLCIAPWTSRDLDAASLC